MYGNSKFVFVVLLPIVLVMAVVASYVWPVAAAGINALTGVMASAGAFGVFLYGFLNRVLIPTGLHHLVWSPFVYSVLGDSMIIGGEQFVGAKPVFLALLSDPSVAMMRDSARFLTYGMMKTFGVIGVAMAFISTAKKGEEGRHQGTDHPGYPYRLSGGRDRAAGVHFPVCSSRAVAGVLGSGRSVPDDRLPCGRPGLRHQRHH